MSEFIVSGVVRYKESFFVASCGSADYASATDCGLDNRDEGAEF